MKSIVDEVIKYGKGRKDLWGASWSKGIALQDPYIAMDRPPLAGALKRAHFWKMVEKKSHFLADPPGPACFQNQAGRHGPCIVWRRDAWVRWKLDFNLVAHFVLNSFKSGIAATSPGLIVPDRVIIA